MYEKLMYKVPSKDNKVIYRLQDFTKNDNVDESMFVEGQNSQGKTRLQCNVFVLHAHEFEELLEDIEQSKQHVKELNNKIKQKEIEIKRLQDEIDKHNRANVDYEAKLQDEKFNMLVEHQEAVDELKEMHENELTAIYENNKENIKKLRAQYNAKLDDVNEHLFESVKANGVARDKLRGEMVQMKQDHKDEVINLQNKHHREVENIQHAHSNQLQELRNEHAYDIDKLKQVIADNKQEHLTEVNKLQREHIHETDEMRTSFLKLLANEHAQDLSDFNECGELPFVVKLFANGFYKNFNEFKKRKYKNTPQKIVETYELAPSRDE